MAGLSLHLSEKVFEGDQVKFSDGTSGKITKMGWFETMVSTSPSRTMTDISSQQVVTCFSNSNSQTHLPALKLLATQSTDSKQRRCRRRCTKQPTNRTTRLQSKSHSTVSSKTNTPHQLRRRLQNPFATRNNQRRDQ